MATTDDAITVRTVDTSRIGVQVHHRTPDAGDAAGVTTVLVHGNVSSSVFFHPLLRALPTDVPAMAVDLRGFGGSDPAPVDATPGLRDFADDVWATLDALGLDRVHLVGWSMGGGVVLQMLLDAPGRVHALTLVNPVSPYGFGGTGPDGAPVHPDGAGSGAGGANPQFVAALAADVGTDQSDPFSPRSVLRAFYVAPGWPHQGTPLEDELVASMRTTVTGMDNYPGDAAASPHWPTLAPGRRGVLNTMAPTHLDLSGVVDIAPRPPVLWIRGEVDQIVSDASMFDLAQLGRLGAVPGYPGVDEFPPQPMVGQTRAVLDRYAAAGGQYREVVLPGVGHSPHIEQTQVVADLLVGQARS
ncbi:alpha/beta hydrolase [Nakamurella flava]|uniref:Alpha/beta hydrolase n=1 Tax=Nakamurella flava TaxID=2576308 RepID=A0A4U6QFK4_9ACTN|nr:alpha/beta hydrolase [Nakamurella flava]TKV58950.1 alpha/beta hydrolase [Nakamurella flava]